MVVVAILAVWKFSEKNSHEKKASISVSVIFVAVMYIGFVVSEKKQKPTPANSKNVVPLKIAGYIGFNVMKYGMESSATR